MGFGGTSRYGWSWPAESSLYSDRRWIEQHYALQDHHHELADVSRIDDWSDEWLALCDDQEGFVEMYRFKDELLAKVARVDIPEKGFGMNAIWYD